MPCYSPLRAVVLTTPQGRSLSFKRTAAGKGVSLPCGRCIGCRLERARQWAVRVVHEAKMHDEAVFITLTYSEDKLPKGGTLVVEHCQLFMKRLRKKLAPRKIRFFLGGEYGEVCKKCGEGRKVCRCLKPKFEIGRPHYHAIIFGYAFPDKKALPKKGEFTLYTSKELEDAWGFGQVSIGAVTFDSACYVANYATKKVNGKKADEHYKGRRPEFLLMSRKPGIGRAFIERFMSEVYAADSVVVRGHEARPPRYYDQVLEKNNPELLESLKAKREEQAEKLEAHMHKMADGSVVKLMLAPSRNVYRLAVRRRVAEAKQKLKSRNLED